MDFPDGPINLIPASITFCANEEFSDKKPYPGCIPSTFKFLAASMISSCFK